MFHGLKLRRLHMKQRKLEVELAGEQAALKAVEMQMKMTSKMSLHQEGLMIKHIRRIAEVNTLLAHVQKDILGLGNPHVAAVVQTLEQ